MADSRRVIPCEAMTRGSQARGIVLVADGDAAAWRAFIDRTASLNLVADVPWEDDDGHDALDAVLATHPDAAVLACLAPRAALRVALNLARRGRAGLVAAPLWPARFDAPHEEAAARRVQVAHGWRTLPWMAELRAHLEAHALGPLHLRVRGQPGDAQTGELRDALWHALAFVHTLDAALRVRHVELRGERGLRATFATEGPATRTLTLDIEAQADRPRLELQSEQAGLTYLFERDEVSWLAATAPAQAARPQPPQQTLGQRTWRAPVAPYFARCLAQLFSPHYGDSLIEAHAVAMAFDACATHTPGLLQPTSSDFERARRRRAEGRLIGSQLGLATTRGPALASSASNAAGDTHPPSARLAQWVTPSEPWELWAFRTGRKPVAFLTVKPHEVDATLALFGDVHALRLERRVEVGPQDTWRDDRARGERRVELYLSKDRALAERAATLQSASDPTRAMGELGALMGYPTCCVDAFFTQRDRANNTRNRYATAARTEREEAWPWLLNNLHAMPVPFFPCRYDCASALAFAREVWSALAQAHAALAARLQVALSAPALYFEHGRCLVFEGARACTRTGLRYEGVLRSPPEDASADEDAGFTSLPSDVARGRSLTWTDEALRVFGEDGALIREWARTDPGLGFLAPFAPD